MGSIVSETLQNRTGVNAENAAPLECYSPSMRRFPKGVHANSLPVRPTIGATASIASPPTIGRNSLAPSSIDPSSPSVVDTGQAIAGQMYYGIQFANQTRSRYSITWANSRMENRAVERAAFLHMSNALKRRA